MDVLIACRSRSGLRARALFYCYWLATPQTTPIFIATKVGSLETVLAFDIYYLLHESRVEYGELFHEPKASENTVYE